MNSPAPKKIYVVDVSSMFFRAFYAVRPLTSSKGVPVNAVYGFISMIIKLFKDKAPDHIVFCHDRKEPSFRKELYTEYKANRTTMPEEMQVQMPYLKKVGDLFGICGIELDKFEADDLIGTVAAMAQKENYEVFIVSGDKDFCQLVNKNVFLYDTMKDVIFDEAMVKEKHGVHPLQFIDYLAITGDTSDNIPGVAGIGPKGAQKLIEQFGTLENIYENINEISSQSIKDKLIQSKENAILSKTLVTIVCDAPIKQTLEDFELKGFKSEELRSFLQELNFKTFEKNLFADGKESLKVEAGSAPVASVAPTVATVMPAGELTVQLNEWDSAAIQQKINNNEAAFVFNHADQFAIGFGQSIYFKPASEVDLDFKTMVWNGYDIKNTWHKLAFDDSKKFSLGFDLMLASYIIKASDTSDIEKLAKQFLDRELGLKAIEAVADKIKNIYQVFVDLEPIVKKELDEKELTTIYAKLEKPLIPILYKMEKLGIELDTPFLKKYSDLLGEDILKLETKIYELAGEKFNVASPKQLGVILFEKLGIEALKKTKTGYSTDNDVLEAIDHPIAKEVIDYRELAKLKSTYVDSLPLMADAHGRVHTHFNQALTATGRLSSINPNLQNIPIRTERGQKVRQAFIAGPGKKLLSVDYSQIELRVLAHISNDPALIQAFKDDLDIHTATAAEVFSISLDAVTKEQRRIAKAVNFGIAYGQGAYGLAETLGISRKESTGIIEKYFLKFPGIQEYIESTIKSAYEKKYVETLFGRRRYITELDNKNVMIKKFGERAAINAPIQGTASDLVKMAMIELVDGLKLDMLLQVHDELIFEGTEEAIQSQLKWIVKTMESVAKLKVPLKVNYAIGDNWDQAH